MRTKAHKRWQCPYYHWDGKSKNDGYVCVHCEFGMIDFPDKDALNYYSDKYCSNAVGWKDCTIAKMANDWYERQE